MESNLKETNKNNTEFTQFLNQNTKSGEAKNNCFRIRFCFDCIAVFPNVLTL